MKPTVNTIDAAKIAGVTPQAIGWWVRSGYLKPEEDQGKGPNRGYRFTVAAVRRAMVRKPNKPGRRTNPGKGD